MKDEDLTDLFAGLAMMGMLAENGGGALANRELAGMAYSIADAMIEAKYAKEEPEEGITAIKPKRKRSVNVSSTTD